MIRSIAHSCCVPEQDRAKALVVSVAVNSKCWLSKSSLVDRALQLRLDRYSSANAGGCIIAVAAAAMDDSVAAVRMVGSLPATHAFNELNVDWSAPGEV